MSGTTSGGGSGTTGGTTSPSDFPNPLTILLDPTVYAGLATNNSTFATELAKALFDEYFNRLNQINQAQIALQSALAANSQVLSLQNQIASLQDNNSVIAYTAANPPSSTESQAAIQTARNNYQISLLQKRLVTAQSAASTV